MGQKVFTGVMVAIAIGLVVWVGSRQASNRDVVTQSLDGIRLVVVEALPGDADRADRIVREYAAQATGFERTVSKTELFLSRQAFVGAMDDGVLTEAEAQAILSTMSDQMEGASSTVLRPTDGGSS